METRNTIQRIKLPPIGNLIDTNNLPPIIDTANNKYKAEPKLKQRGKKRQRKKFEDVKRLYYCDFQNCNKGYGSLTHLNEHRVIQKHGPRKKIDDFKHIKLLLQQEQKPLQHVQQSIQQIPTTNKLLLPPPNTRNFQFKNNHSLINYHYPINHDQSIEPIQPRSSNIVPINENNDGLIVQSLLKMKNEK